MYSFPNESPNSHDPATKRGIIILSIALLLLISFFAWYKYRTLQLPVLSNNKDTKESFLDKVLHPNGSSSDSTKKTNDSDEDGLTDDEERGAGTDSSKIDTDSDGLVDRDEVKVYKTNPLQADSDGDSINDSDEIKKRRDPLNSDPNAPWPPTPTVFSNQ